MDDEFVENQREEIGRKPGATSGAAMQREPISEKVKEGWLDFKAKIRQKWNQLTDKDIEPYATRDRAAFVAFVHGRVGGDRTLVERDLDAFSRDTNYRW